MKISQHPVLVAPSAAQSLAMGAEKWEEFMLRREKMIALEQQDPLRYGWEPPIWTVVDALLGFDFCSGPLAQYLQQRFGFGWEEYARRMREKLGFREPVKMVLILGGNRSGKSEYAAKRGQLVLSTRDRQRVNVFHMSNPRSVLDQQPLFWKYMPQEWKIQKATETFYIKFKHKTGFSDGSFINPRDGYCAFGNYMQDKDTALEGLESDLVLPDELIPVDWLETLIYRLATRAGKGITCFTPVNGYTPSVGLFCTGSEVAMESTGFLLPADGGEPDLARALGVLPEELMEVNLAAAQKRAATAPRSRPEDVFAWLEDDDRAVEDRPAVPRTFGYGQAQMAPEAGREFRKVPRVLRSARPDLAVVYFHSADNPFGNPAEVMKAALNKNSTEETRIRVYGLADRAAGGKFPRFNKRVHRIAAAAVPAEGVNYMLMDPAGDRNFFMLWMRKAPGTDFAYREWPGNYAIPGVGFPGPWAVPSGRKEGKNDGARGEGQEKFGFGLLRYKFEIARVEGWEDFVRWCVDKGYDPARLPDHAIPGDDELYEWSETNGAREVIEQRYVDSRAASTPRVEMDRPVTLLTDLDDIGFDFLLTPGDDETTGITAIESALAYDVDQEQSFVNHPKLLVSDACPNLLYALENYTGADGQKGACRDPIDLLRYFYTLDLTDEAGGPRSRGGFHYGFTLPSMRRRRAGRTADGRPLCMGVRVKRDNERKA